MSKRYSTSLFIFRRDLRLFDNTGLNAALQRSDRVLACFIFDPRQIECHPYQSGPGLQFMLEALLDLQRQLQQQGGVLYLFNAQPEAVVLKLHQERRIEAVFVNRDYTPFSKMRDTDLQSVCNGRGIQFHTYGDVLLNEPEDVLKADSSAYQVFTAFYNRARQIPVAVAQALANGKFVYDLTEAANLIDSLKQPHRNPVSGGRQAALAQLESLTSCQRYTERRDFPAIDATSGLSAYLKFGCCSIREAYYAVLTKLGSEHALLRQFFWRDFFTHIGHHFPHVFGRAFHSRYDDIVWRNNDEEFQAWTLGRTGFPIVDAGMRQLRQAGCMHNRVRMITASFLVKDLQIDWRWGERYFAQQLVDYDPCVNNGNWQWAASTGCDAQPYFRIFNPWLQQKKFDSDCVYIKRWLPELRNFPATDIHASHKKALTGEYPVPIVDHGLRSQQTKLMFQEGSKG